MDTPLARRRQLRRSSTDAEAFLWYHLRSRRLAGFKFRRQHPYGPFILDFFCAERNLAIELDGGQHFEPATSTAMPVARATSFSTALRSCVSQPTWSFATSMLC